MVQLIEPGDRPLILGHRGASAYAAENTIAALQLALDQGADGVEIDVRRCADGGLVLSHDPYLADGTAIVDLGRADLIQLAPDIPDLGDAIAVLAGAFVNVEIKNMPDEPDFDPTGTVARAVAALLSVRNFRGVVSSFNPATVEHFAALAPAIPAGLLTPAGLPIDQAVEAATGLAAWHPHWTALTDGSGKAVARAHEANLRVITWTVDEPTIATELAAQGVDAIITNDPPALLAALS